MHAEQFKSAAISSLNCVFELFKVHRKGFGTFPQIHPCTRAMHLKRAKQVLFWRKYYLCF